MKYLETVIFELMQYKKQDSISPTGLLTFTYDIIYSEKIINSELLSQANYIKNNTAKELLIPLATLEFIYEKNKHSKTTSQQINIRNRMNKIISATLGDIIRWRQDAIINLIQLQDKIIRLYDITPKMHNGETETDYLKKVRNG